MNAEQNHLTPNSDTQRLLKMARNLKTIVWCLRFAAIISGLFLFGFRIFVGESLDNLASNVQALLSKYNVPTGEADQLDSAFSATSNHLSLLFFAGLVLIAVGYGSLERLVKRTWPNKDSR